MFQVRIKILWNNIKKKKKVKKNIWEKRPENCTCQISKIFFTTMINKKINIPQCMRLKNCKTKLSKKKYNKQPHKTHLKN